jgi:hypothetical protein
MVLGVVRASCILQQMSFATVARHNNNSIRCRLKQHNTDRAAPLQLDYLMLSTTAPYKSLCAKFKFVSCCSQILMIL